MTQIQVMELLMVVVIIMDQNLNERPVNNKSMVVIKEQQGETPKYNKNIQNDIGNNI